MTSLARQPGAARAVPAHQRPGAGRACVSGARRRCSSSRSRRASPWCRCCWSCCVAVAEVRPSDPSAKRATQRRSARQRAPGRGAQDVRARHRAPRRGHGRAADARSAARRRSAMPRGMGRPRRRAAPDARAPRARRARRRSRRRSEWPRSSRSSTRRCCASARAPTGASATPWASTPRAGSTRVRAALQTPIETPDYPGRKFIVQCADIAARRRDARARGRPDAGRAGVARHRSSTGDGALAARAVRRDLGAAGRARQSLGAACPAASTWASRRRCRRRRCRRISSPARAASPTRSCASSRRCCGVAGADRPAARAAAASPAKPSAGHAAWTTSAGTCRRRSPSMLQPLETLQRPTGSLYRAVHRRAAGAGRDADELSLRAEPDRHRRDADRRRLFDRPHDRARRCRRWRSGPPPATPAARTSAGRWACSAARTRRSAIGHACSSTRWCAWPAVAVIDVASGRIEALAGALSPCTRQEYDGPGRAANCDKRLPYPIRYRPDALLNPAVFHDAMPASVIKPIMAAAFLSDRGRRRALARRRAGRDAASRHRRRSTACAAS